MKTNTLTRWLTGLTLALSLAGMAQAAEVAGVKVDESVKVAGKELKLNGAGLRTRIVVKVYVLALYLSEKKDAPAAVFDAAGPRRFVLTMMREVTGDELAQFGEAFVNIPQAKKGDTVTVDWLPDTGTVMFFNGKQIGEPMKDIGFYNAVLKIWLGDKPVDSSLKPALLGKG